MPGIPADTIQPTEKQHMFDRFFGKLGAAFSLGLLCLIVPGTALADFPPTKEFPNTGNFQARHVRDKGDVSVIELTGSYDRELADKEVNIEPRTVVAKEFFRTHQDRYDFVVVFSNFEFQTGDALAFHIGVKNQVKGLGIAQYDNSAHFGSSGKLQGYIDMAALSRYVTNPFDARFDNVLQVFAHEFLHQWGANVRFRLNGGEPSTALLGKDNAHWSFLLNSGASVEYGNQWRDNGNGTFTSVAGRQFFSPLDLYLMGMYRKEEVPPFFLIDNPDIDRERLPLNDVTISGVRKTITIDDVVAAEGPREPDAANAQKEFRLGFVLLSRPGIPATDAQLTAVNNIRRAIATRLAVLTGGRAMAHSYLEAKPQADAGPGTNPDGVVREGAADVAAGMAWLRDKQSTDGFWKDNAFTTIRDTAIVFDTLGELDGVNFAGRDKAVTWLSEQPTSNTDYLARQIRALSGTGKLPVSAVPRLLALQNSDGGWGVASRYQSNPLDTALALRALLQFESTLAAGKLAPATAFLEKHQNTDGGWGNLQGGASRTAVTATVLQALKGRAVAPAVAVNAIAFLATRQNSDGGFGDSPSTVHDTANVLSALLSQNAMGKIRSAEATAYIASSQLVDGSWDGSVYSTSLAVRLLKSAGLFNWTTGELKAMPAAPLDGQKVVLSFKVVNSGTALAPAGIARAYDGDPGNGGQQIGNDMTIPPLVAGDSVELKLLWNTLDKAGNHTIVLQVDPGNTVPEASKADNRAQTNVTVLPAPVPVELSVSVADVIASPSRPNKLPAVIAVSAQIYNIGRTDATDVRVVLRAGGPDSPVIDEKIVNLLGRSQQVVNFTTTLTQPGSVNLTVAVDPDGRISEADETNNAAAVTVETVPTLDLEVLDAETTIDRDPVFMGADATFRTRIRNAGTQETPLFKVRYTLIAGGDQKIELDTRTIQLGAGKASDQEFVWRSDRAGDLHFKVDIDPDGLLTELDETNNDAMLPFKVVEASGVNLSVSHRQFVVNPAQVLEGQEVKLSQTVRNSGNVTANNIEVAFYDGDPVGGRLIGELQVIPTLAPGESALVHATWTKYPDAGDHLVFFVADPASKQLDTAREDNAAFIVLSANSMADLAISSGDIQITPELPNPTDALAVSATVTNLGKQAAANVVVRAFDGDPTAGGKQVGNDQTIPMLAGLSTQVVQFAYPASGIGGARAVVIVVDPANAVTEKNEENNTARRNLMAQDGNFFVTNRYFSPNGDSVKDSTTLGIRLKSAADITVNVLNKAGKLMRIIGGDSLKNVTATEVTWDGLNQRGSVVADGDYTLRVMDRNGNTLGEALVAVDTNRSSILEAIDTAFGYTANLTCDLRTPFEASQLTESEDRLFTMTRDFDDANREGVFSMQPDGGDRKLILPASQFDYRSGGGYFTASLDGGKVSYVEDYQDQSRLWVMDGDGSNKRLLGQFSSHPISRELNADGSAIVMIHNGKVLKYPTNGEQPTVLVDLAEGTRMDLAFSPDRGTALLSIMTNGGVVTKYQMIETASARVVTLPESARELYQVAAGSTQWTVEWSPNSKLLVMGGHAAFNKRGDYSADAFKYWLFDTNFNHVKTFKYQAANPAAQWTMLTGRPTWNSNGTEFAYELSYCKGTYDDCTYVEPPSESFFMARMSTPMTEGPTEEFNNSVLVVADVLTGNQELIASSRVPRMRAEGVAYSYLWVPNERTIVRSGDGHGCDLTDENKFKCFDAIDLDNGGAIRPLFTQWHSAPDVVAGFNGFMELERFTKSGNRLLFTSGRAAEDPAGACFETGPDKYAFSSLLNMTADLRALRSANTGGLILRGSAADANFSRYVIEYANKEAPTAWKTAAPASSEPVVDQVFMTWAPPAYGNYLLRLTVEDLAGNKRQLIRNVSWTDTPSISDLYKDSEFISPNGDSNKDGISLHYRVVEPVHLVFNVYDAQQTLVRTLEVDHKTTDKPDAGQVFKWDGRDNRGRTVPDGIYKITVLDYEFFVTLDTQAPKLSLEVADAYGFSIDHLGNKVTKFAPTITWEGSDANLARFGIERGTGEFPSDWKSIPHWPQGPLKTMVKLEARDFVDQRYRAIIEDKAGNRVEIAPPLGAQQVFLLEYGDDIGFEKFKVDAQYPDRALIDDLPRLVGLGGDTPVRFVFAQTVRRPIAKVLVQFKPLTESDRMLPRSDLDTLEWQEALVPYRVFEPGNPALTLVWDMDGVAMETDYLVRIKVVDQDEAVIVSEAPYVLRRKPELLLGIREVSDMRPDVVNVEAVLKAPQPAERVDLIIKSTTDVRYTEPRVVHTVRDAHGLFAHRLEAAVLADLDLRICQSYEVRLRAVFANGQTKDSESHPLQSRCIGADWIIAPETAATCDATPAGRMQVTLKPFAGDGRKLTQLVFGQVTNEGGFDVLNNWNDPQSGATYQYVFDVSGVPAGTKTYFVRVINEDGKIDTKEIKVPVSHVPAQARITYPGNGQKVCGRRMRDPNNLDKFVSAIAIEGSVTSNGMVSQGLEVATAGQQDWRTASPAAVPWEKIGFSGLRVSHERDLVDGYDKLLCNYPDAKLCADFHPIQWSIERLKKKSGFPGEVPRSGTLAHLGLTEQIEGEVSVRLRVFDEAGYQTCSAPVTFDFDNQVRVEKTTADVDLFSPHALERPTHVTLKVVANESVSATLRVYRGFEDGDEVRYSTTPTRTLTAGEQIIAGESMFTWDGNGEGASPAADGLYKIVAEYTDSCGNVATHDVLVTLDATGPLVQLASPLSNNKVGLQVAVTGAVRDPHFASYVADFESPSQPDQWTPLASRATPTAGELNEVLASWSTLGLTGPVRLRVRALDRAGNLTTTIVPLEVAPGGKAISYLESVPAMFSPNGDNKLDSAAIRFGLTARANVTLEIRRGSATGELVKTLVSAQPTEAGAVLKAWDGKNLSDQPEPDGPFAAKLVVTTLDEPVSVQEESILLTLDNTKPTLALNYPQTGFAPAKGDLRVTARDAHLSNFKAYLSTGATLSNWQLIAEEATEQVSASILELSTLAEGKYGIKLVAVDQAENATELIELFEIDNTPPKVAISAPLAGSYLGAKKGLAAIAATIDEKNLAQYQMRFGQGTPSVLWTELAAGTVLSAPLTMNWDVAAIPDGAYTLWLHATDRAGQDGAATQDVIIDNTAPTAHISSPAAGAYVRQAHQITGVAHDANLHNYTIEIAPGTKSTATRWSLLHTGTTAVAEGKLLDWQALPADGAYTLRLKVLDKVGAVAEALSEVEVDTKAPAAPLNLNAKLENRNDARLTWDASRAADVAGYAVFRNGTRLNAELLTQTSYADLALANDTYTYEVKALDKAGWLSDASNQSQVVVNMTGPNARIYTPVRGALISSLYEISGSANAQLDFKEYRLYVGAGENPSAWRLLRRSPAPVQIGILGSWDTLGIAENAVQSIKLEAEDTYGTIATDIVTVAVDNTPPAAPLQLQANASGNNVTLSWTPSPSPDLAGYIVLRDERIANAQGAVIGSWKPYLVTNASYLDLGVPDGEHRYVVLAMDRAENLSAPSNTVTIKLDTRAPHALMVQPLAKAHIGNKTYLLAHTPDTDIASVQFQYKAANAIEWINVGAAATKLPYEATLEDAGLVLGDYAIQAIATDTNGKTDPNPTPIVVTYSETPDVITDLKASVNGGDVTLTWSSPATGLTGYVLERYNREGGVDRIDVPAQASASYVDRALPDYHYRYRVSAVGASGKPNMSSDDVPARVHTPQIEVPLTPTAEATLTLVGKSALSGTMTLVTRAEVVIPDLDFATAGDGSFNKAEVVVPMGATQYELRHVDLSGNISKPALFEMQRGTPPAMPVGLATSAGQGEVTVTWNANSEPDLLGYYVVRNGVAQLQPIAIERASASSTDPRTWEGYPIDGGTEGSYWSPDPLAKNVEKTFTLHFAQASTLSKATVTWNVDGIVSDFDLQIPAGAGNWATVAAIRGNKERETTLTLPQLRVAEFRIRMHEQQVLPRLVEVALTGPAIEAETSLTGQLTRPSEVFQVFAVNQYGMQSLPADITHNGAVELPELVVDSAAIVVENGAPKVGSTVRLAALVANQGKSPARDFSTSLSITDGNGATTVLGTSALAQLDPAVSDTLRAEWIPTVAGEYTVTMVADQANSVAEGNEGNNSASIKLVVQAADAGLPMTLSVSAPPAGQSLQLHWTAPQSVQPAGYRIRVAAAEAGPYAVLIASTSELSHLDQPLANGVRRFYVATAIDADGRVIATSAPASGMTRDSAAPGAPVLMAPTHAGKPVSVSTATVDVVGMAEPGARVSLVRGTSVLDTATASTEVVRKLIDESGAAPFDVTADGRRLALGRLGTVIDMEKGTSYTITDLGNANFFRWSHRGDLLALVSDWRANTPNALQIINHAEQSATPQSNLHSVAGGLAWSHDDSQIAVIATSNGKRGLQLYDVATGTSRLLIAGNQWEFRDQMSWSPDGQYLAIAHDSRVRVLKTSDASVVFAEQNWSINPSWSADGTRLLYEFNEGQGAQIGVLTLADKQRRALTDLSVHRSRPVWLGPNGDFIHLEQDSAVWRGADGVKKGTLVDEGYMNANPRMASNGMLWYEDNFSRDVYRVTVPGTFTFDKVRLTAGENLLSAHATDGSGNRSASSQPISVTLIDGMQPDLSATLGDLIVLPSAPLVGEASRVTVTVRNNGGVEATGISVSLNMRSPGGVVTTLHTSTIASLGSLESRSIALDWTPAQTGQYSLALSLDAANTVAETSESNNVVERIVTVASSALPSLQVSTDAALYGSDAVFAGKVTLANAGPEMRGTLEMRIEDLEGYLVESLPTANVTLGYGQSTAYPAAWNTGAILAGEYRLAAQLRDERNVQLSSGSASFRIGAAHKVSAAVSVEHAQYQQHQAANIGASINLADGNANLSGASALIQVLDAGDAVVFESVEALGDLLPGASANVSAIWNIGNSAVGNYRIKLSVKAGGALLASALADVAVVLDDSVQLAGSMTLSSPTLALGDRLDVTYTVRNGGAAIAGLPLTVTIVNPESQAVLASASANVDLARGASIDGAAQFVATDWPMKTLQVVLSAQLDGQPRVLQRMSLRVLDRTAPVVVFALAAQSGKLVAGSAMPILVQATDSQSLVASVEYTLAGSAWTPFLPEDRSNALYRMSLAGLADGPLKILARATDSAGNVSEIVALDLTVDNTAPLIRVTGVADAAVYTSAVTPQVAIEDAHLQSSTITLDGAPYVSGTPVNSNGAHTLQIEAIDLAGNRTDRTVRFELALPRPVVTIASPSEMAFLRPPFSLSGTASSTGASIASVEYQLDGGVWTGANAFAGGLHGVVINEMADGVHQGALRATDTNGSVSDVARVNFTVDASAPLITVSGVVDGQSYSGTVTPVIGINDANLLSSQVLLDGQPYVSATAITTAGAHTLQVDAEDKAGNKSARTVQFQIVTAKPVVVMITPAQDAFVCSPNRVTATASSGASTIAKVEYLGVDMVWRSMLVGPDSVYAGQAMSLSNGSHQVSVRATDAAGGVSDVVTHAFVVDCTAPAVTIGGVVQGQTYTDSVTATVAVSDENLLSSTITLDGEAYVSGTPITKLGSHTLLVVAEDKAGNKTSKSVGFQVAQSPPVVSITAPLANALVTTPLNVQISASSTVSTIGAVEFQIDGGAWTGTTMVGAGKYQASIAFLADGVHTISARATDANSVVATTAARSFTVDNTAPVITVTGVADGASYGASVTPVVTINDANPDKVVLLLNNVAYVSGQPVSGAGEYVLFISATDKLGNKSEKTVRFTIASAVSGTLIVMPKPVAIGSKLFLNSKVSNQGPALASAKFRVQILQRSSMAIVHSYEFSASIAEGGSYTNGSAWTATGQAGDLMQAQLSYLDNGVYRVLTVSDFPLGQAAKMSGTVTGALEEVNAGSVQPITQKLVNGDTALTGAALKVTISNVQTNAVVFTHNSVVNLAANATWTGDLGWTASAPGRYLIKLAVSMDGKTLLQSEYSFTVTDPGSTIDTSFGSVIKQRILVLSQCKRAETAYLGACGVAPIVVDQPATLARCDSERAVAVTRYLDSLGVSHKLVTTEAQFALEVKTGGYTGYWVSGGGTKLRQPLQTELNAGLLLGEALVVDGMHDLRDSDRALQSLVGVFSNGRVLPGPVKLSLVGEMFPVNDFDVLGDRLLVDTLDGATVEGQLFAAGHTFNGKSKGNGNGYGHCIGSANGHDKNGDGIDDHGHGVCAPATDSQAGLVSGSFGAGHTLFFGFDWVASMKAAPANTRWLDLGRISFDWLRPVEQAPGTALIAGDVITRKIGLNNTGLAADLTVVAQLPRGAKAMVADPAAQVTDNGGAMSVTWQLKLAAAEQRDLSLQFKLPREAGMHDLRYTVTSNAGGKANVVGGDIATLQVNGVAELAAAVQDAVGALDVTGGAVAARADVLRWIGKALQSSNAGNDADALRELVMAQTRLDNISGTELADAQLALARMIRAVERRH